MGEFELDVFLQALGFFEMNSEPKKKLLGRHRCMEAPPRRVILETYHDSHLYTWPASQEFTQFSDFMFF